MTYNIQYIYIKIQNFYCQHFSFKCAQKIVSQYNIMYVHFINFAVTDLHV
jgi:hypothetical protein